jgi:2-polyprenyl-6-methoxyphenol hydroxylase-like FAD-dependent oxidoreductase
MRRALVVGGSVAGLAAALALSREGFAVRVLDAEPPPPPGPPKQAAPNWARPSVPQAFQSHTITSLAVCELRRHVPDLLDALLAAGAVLFDLTTSMPAGPYGAQRAPGDADLVALGCRRTVFELILRQNVMSRPNIEISHGVTVRALRIGPRREVRAVVTDGAREVPASLVIDATGRRAGSRAWLRAAGVPLPADEIAASGLSGYARHYRLRGSALPGPLNRGHAAGYVGSHCAAVLHPGDGDAFAVALGVLPGDRSLRVLRDPDSFTAAVRTSELLAPWLEPDVCEAVSPVYAMTAPPNALRISTLQSGVRGLYPVGDAACVTNPLFGRGIALALAQAFALGPLLSGSDETEAGPAAADLAQRLLRPWFEHAAEADRERIGRWRAASDVPLTPAPIAAAAAVDRDVWRALTSMLMTLRTPAEAFGAPGFAERVRRAAAIGRPTADAPRRPELLEAIAATRRPQEVPA